MKKFITWIMVIGTRVMSCNGNPPADDESKKTTSFDTSNEEEDDDDETDKAVSGISTSFGWGLLMGSTGMLFMFTPEAQQEGGSAGERHVHEVSLMAAFLAIVHACMLLYYTLAKPGPSRQATRAKKRIAGVGFSWFVLCGVSRFYLALPPLYRTSVTVPTSVGVIISAIILYPVLWESTSTPTHKKSKCCTTKQCCCPLQHPNVLDRLLRVEETGNKFVYVFSPEVNQHEGYGGKTTTGGTSRTQRDMPMEGGGDFPSPLEYTGDPLVQSNQGNQQPSSIKGNQEIQKNKAVNPHQEPMERAKGNKEESNKMMKMINSLDKGQGIMRSYDELQSTTSSLHDCSSSESSSVIDGPSSRANRTKWKYKNNNQQPNSRVNQHEEYHGETTIEDPSSKDNRSNRTQNGMLMQGGHVVLSPLEDIGDPLVQLNKENQQSSSRKKKQEINIDEMVKSCDTPVERVKGIKEEPNLMIKVINLLDRNSNEWKFAISFLHEGIIEDILRETNDPSKIANWIKWKYMTINQQSKDVVVGNEEVGVELPSMMRMWMPRRETGS